MFEPGMECDIRLGEEKLHVLVRNIERTVHGSSGMRADVEFIVLG